MQKSAAITVMALMIFMANGGVDAGEVLDASFDDDGLAELQFEGQSWAIMGKPTVRRIRVKDEYRDKRAEARDALRLKGPEEAAYIDGRSFEDGDSEERSRKFDPEKRRLTQTYAWGRLQVDYTIEDNRLGMAITVNNESNRVIESISISGLGIELGEEVEYDGDARRNISQPTVLKAANDEVQLLLTNEQAEEPLRLQWKKRDGKLVVSLRAGHPKGGAEVYDGIWNVRPIDRGESDTYKLSLRFADADADSIKVARDVYDRFREAFPPNMQWYDRRPIGTLYFGGYHDATAENPRRYIVGGFPPKDMDVSTEKGREKLRESLLDHADRVIEMAEKMGLQGVIVWDVEGTEYPHPITYLDSISALPTKA